MNIRSLRASFWRGARSLRLRILAAFVVTLGALVGAQAYLVSQQRPIIDALSVITEGYLPLTKTVARLNKDAQRVERDLERLLNDEQRPATGSASPTLIYTEELQHSIEIGRIKLATLKRRTLPSEEQAMLGKIATYLDSIDAKFQDYQRQATDFVRVAEAGDLQQVSALGEPLRRTGALLQADIDQLERTLDEHIFGLTAATERSQIRAATVAGALSIVAFAVSFIAMGAGLYSLRPIGALTRQVQRLAAGDYGGRVEGTGADEIAVLAAEFNAMVRAIETRDRTLVERAEELNRLSHYLGSVLNNLDDGLMVFEDQQTTLTNPAATRVWGSEVGHPPPNDVAEVLTPGRHSLQGPNGTLHDVRVTPFGKAGVIVVSVDVTEQTRAKEALARSERLALVGQMLAQITHEVRNPLNALSLNAELLEEELQALDPEHTTESWEILALVASEIDRLTDVTGHYLQLARRPPAQHEPTDLRMVVDDLVRLFELELEEINVVLSTEVEDLPPQRVDASQLKQAVLNVVRNATEAGAKRLLLSVRAMGNEVQISLHDDGPGMSDDEIERAFDPFFSTKATGTGLGLAITRQILEDHDGTIEVVSRLGEGTVISLCFPRSEPT